jgi:transcriptional regulator with XRE-family HTH domain
MEQNDTLTTKETFLNNLKFLMDERGLSHSDIGKLVGFSRQQVGNIFNGENKGLNTLTMDKVSKALGFEENGLASPEFITNFVKMKNRYK